MKDLLRRQDDYEVRRQHLANLSEEELKARFWDLTQQVIDPLLALAKTNTTPSVERSVLLRMGFSSLECKPLVEMAMDHGLIGHGVGHVIYRIGKENNIPYRQAGLEMIDGRHWDQAIRIFKGGQK